MSENSSSPDAPSAPDLVKALTKLPRRRTTNPLDPQTGVLIPISLTPTPTPISGYTSAPFVATATPTGDLVSWKRDGKKIKILDVSEVNLYFWVTTVDGVEIYPVDTSLYTYDVSFPTEGVPTGILLLEVDGDGVLDQASTYSPEPVDSLYMLVFLSTQLTVDMVDSELSGYGIIPVIRSTDVL